MTILSLDDRRQIQGIVTTGFGHLSCGGFLFARFRDAEPARGWLRALLPEVTTATPWEKNERGEKRRPRTTLNVALTYDGLEELEVPRKTLGTFPTEFAFGMPSRATILGDHDESDPARWELGGPSNPPVHAVLVVYANGEQELDARLDELRLGFADAVEELRVERGARTDRSREPFGFASDGISQPIIEGIRGDDPSDPFVVKTGEFILGHVNEMGLYPLSPAVAADEDPDGILPPYPEGALPEYRDLGRNGTYFVYRKLHQDVAGFWRFLQSRVSAANRAELQHEMLRTASKLMGRWPSGAPLELAPYEDDPALETANDFMYRPGDEQGLACPIGAHIRRANPRDSLKQIADTREDSIRSANQHRLVRRGIPYGTSLFPPEQIEDGRAPLDLEDDGQPRGLHFFVVAGDLKRQFEFVQQMWLNNPTFAGLFDNKDPIVGDNDEPGYMSIGRLPIRSSVSDIPRFVFMRGGAYFFLPSIAALRYIAREMTP
jgi:Dyp-type peroxidase family